MLCFPMHFVALFRDPLDLEMKCISLDFISNGNIDIVRQVSVFCRLLAKRVKSLLPFHCVWM